jgi:hypothetical protein
MSPTITEINEQALVPFEAGQLTQEEALEAAAEPLRDFMYKQTQMKDAKMFCEIGEDCYIEPPLHSNWGGKHVHFGKNVYANFNLTLVDDTHIYVGDGTMLAPNVVLATAGHPILP